MAKKKSARGVNKSQAIRDYLAAQPKATPNEIVAGLKQQGITVSPGLASNIKYTSGRTTGKKRRGKPPGRRAKPERATNGALTAADLLEAKKLRIATIRREGLGAPRRYFSVIRSAPDFVINSPARARSTASRRAASGTLRRASTYNALG